MATVVPIERRQVLFVLGDTLAALLSLHGAYLLRFGFEPGDFQPLAAQHLASGGTVFFVATHLLLLYLSDAYQTSRDFRRAEELLRLWLAVVAAFALQMALFYAVPEWWVGRCRAGGGWPPPYGPERRPGRAP